jgi:hypothetical protein
MKGFEKLDIDSKSIILHYNGQAIASVIYYNYRATLYLFNELLIEEYYDTETKEISRICTANNHDLRKYLEKIDITDLLTWLIQVWDEKSVKFSQNEIAIDLKDRKCWFLRGFCTLSYSGIIIALHQSNITAMKKRISLLVFLAIGSVVLMAAYRTTSDRSESTETILTSHHWKFEGAESQNARAEAVVNNLYLNAQYNFTTERTFQGEFFEFPIQGRWTLEKGKLILNKGTIGEESYEIAFISSETLKITAIEQGSLVILTFR